jgi:soluble lytic murein transglycosylase-like protein
MKNTLRLKGVAVVALVGLMVLMQQLKTSLGEAETDKSIDYLRYAAYTETKMEKPAPTSDVVPLPFCRRSFIDLSSDAAYPIPHWVYSLPKDADKALVLAIAKNESRFKPYAVSHKGAVGLMQLMPKTASYVVEHAGGANFTLAGQDSVTTHRPRTAFDFNDPYVSLAIGSRYLQHLQKRPFIGKNTVYLLAAYNAGPGMLQQWKRDYPRLSSDAFAAHIPYAETRNYIRRVMNDYRRYQELLPPIEETIWVDGEGC